MIKQSRLLGQVLYHCIHCDWSGKGTLKRNNRFAEARGETDSVETCPKCEWVCYSDEEINESLMNCYPKLRKKAQ